MAKEYFGPTAARRLATDLQALLAISASTFEGVGTVIALQPRRSQIVVDHEEIKGFMGAMIMGYPVKPARLLQGLKAGDRIRFTIDADRKAIVRIERGAP